MKRQGLCRACGCPESGDGTANGREWELKEEEEMDGEDTVGGGGWFPASKPSLGRHVSVAVCNEISVAKLVTRYWLLYLPNGFSAAR